jgi:hypothetical protein
MSTSKYSYNQLSLPQFDMITNGFLVILAALMTLVAVIFIGDVNASPTNTTDTTLCPPASNECSTFCCGVCSACAAGDLEACERCRLGCPQT